MCFLGGLSNMPYMCYLFNTPEMETQQLWIHLSNNVINRFVGIFCVAMALCL